jgi:hypothetical protein
MYNSGNSSKNVTGASIVDGTVETVDIADDAVTADKLANSVNTDIGTGVTGNTTANAALPKAGGAMTGTISNFRSTGIDDNATSTAITINSSEQVSVGTAHTPTSGNVSLGVYSPYDAQLEVKASGAWLRTHSTNASGQGYGGWQHYDSTGGTSTAGIYVAGADNSLRFKNNGSERMRILPTGGITFNGDTAAANALDDYEEGYHNAALTCGTSGTVTVSYNRLNYVKIGRQVTLSGEIVVSAISSPSGGIYMSLPFQNAASTERSARTAYFMDSHSWNAAPDGRVIAYLDSSVTTAQLLIKNQSYSGYETTNYIQVGTAIKVNFTYQAQ